MTWYRRTPLAPCGHGGERRARRVRAGVAAGGGQPARGAGPRAEPGRPADAAARREPAPRVTGNPGPAAAAMAAGPLRAAHRRRPARPVAARGPPVGDAPA